MMTRILDELLSLCVLESSAYKTLLYLFSRIVIVQKLALYGLYKQATIGNVNIENPGALDFVGSAKWNSWKSYEGLSMEYINGDLYFLEMQKPNM